MRIAMIGAKGLPSLLPIGGGVETHVENLARHLVADGHEVTVYVHKFANPEGRKSLDGIRLVTLSSWRRKNLVAISHVFLSSLHTLTENYDVIHYHGVGPSTLSWIPRLFKRSARIVATFHSRDQFHEKWSLFARSYLAFGEWTCVTFPHATIVTSHEIQKLCKLLFNKDTIVIPNGVEVPTHLPGASRVKDLGFKPQEYFLCLARLVPHKAQDVAIKAFKKLNTTAKLAIVGSASFDDAEYADKLKRLAGKDERIVFTGNQDHDTVKQLISNSLALVHPSRSEGLSISILEAMSYGIISILSDIPENLELIDHSGIAFPTGNVEELEKVMRWVLDDPAAAKERGKRAQEIVQRLYSWPAVVRRIEQVYVNNQPVKDLSYERNFVLRNKKTQASS